MIIFPLIFTLMTQPQPATETFGEVVTDCIPIESEIIVSHEEPEIVEERRFEDEREDEQHIVHSVSNIVSSGVYSNVDINLLAQIVHAESKGEPYAGKVAVANVVLNRVVSPGWPDTIREVIYQPKQFQPVSNGAIHNTPSEDSLRASQEAIQTHEYEPVYYFYNPDIASSKWIFSRETVKEIGNHRFAR